MRTSCDCAFPVFLFKIQFKTFIYKQGLIDAIFAVELIYNNCIHSFGLNRNFRESYEFL
jgi:TPR repeat protein